MKMTKEKIIIRVGNRLRITLRKYNIYVKDNIREKKQKIRKVYSIHNQKGFQKGAGRVGERKKKIEGEQLSKKYREVPRN